MASRFRLVFRLASSQHPTHLVSSRILGNIYPNGGYLMTIRFMTRPTRMMSRKPSIHFLWAHEHVPASMAACSRVKSCLPSYFGRLIWNWSTGRALTGSETVGCTLCGGSLKCTYDFELCLERLRHSLLLVSHFESIRIANFLRRGSISITTDH
jgi:hypothetical protein